MEISERLVTALYYALAGLILGWALAKFSSLYLGAEVSSINIVMITVIFCAILGFLLPNTMKHLFHWMWKFFVN